MSYFTVYHGNNEATMFNADCTTGSLLSRMLQMLLPHNSPYTRLELLPLPFVFEYFRPPISRGSASVSTRGGGQSPTQQDISQECCNPTVVKGPPFTGVFPLVGLATRPLESYADALFTNITNTIPSSTATAAAAAAGIPSMLGSTSTCSFGPPMPLQNCFVLLGCRHMNERHNNNNSNNSNGCGTTTSPTHNANTNTNANTMAGKMTPTTGRKQGHGSEVGLKEQQFAALRRAQLIANAPIITQNTQSGTQSVSNRSSTPQPQSGSTSGGGVVATPADCAQIVAYKNGIMPFDKSAAPWRKAFSQYLTSMLQSTNNTTAGGEGTSHNNNNNNNNNTDTVQPKQNGENASSTHFSLQAASLLLDERPQRAVLLPPAATGIFNMPMPPITGYDVLWRGTGGEHIRLQEALDERVITDTDAKKKKPKRA
ncbi:hypothetical protein LSM04_002397 [Trypanosoma melophagium]|uniref:uncharacterized protein n=1 Tax=Trypanosoma melophagium TaxID=715481 RepID=UPI003519E556|nr:hypothetical protein LSM04_002397 [Trypanosoma melophagium]